MKLEYCMYLSIYISYSQENYLITFVKWGSQIHANGFNTLQDAQPYFVTYGAKEIKNWQYSSLVNLEKCFFSFNFSATSHIITLYRYSDESVATGITEY
jgi:hypothetical protein